MIAKLAVLLLLFLAVLAIVGKWAPRLPRIGRRRPPLAGRICQECGRLRDARGRCDCGG